ncbi:hypothetical protein ACWDBD_03105 [Streptomyces sp. NPDC001118]
MDREVVDLGPWRVDVQINTTRMAVRGLENSQKLVRVSEEGAK